MRKNVSGVTVQRSDIRHSNRGVSAMSVDYVLFAIIIGGFVLTGAYLRAQYALQCSRARGGIAA
jgi:hypothetical protein